MTIPDWAAPYAGRTAVVLGAGGFIGRRLASRLAAIGAEVTGVIRPGTVGRLPGIHYLEADLAMPGAAAGTVERIRPAITFNLAGYGVDPGERDPALARRLNAELVEELAMACGAHAMAGWTGRHLVHVGSALEYGTARGDLAEPTIPHPTTLYGQTKLAGTRALEGAAVRGLTARLFTVYGPGEHPGRLLPSLIRAAGREEPVPLTTGAQRRDFTHVDDVVEGLLRLGLVPDADPGAVVNLATGRMTSVREFVECAADLLGIAPERLGFGAVAGRLEEMSHDAVSVARLVDLTGWRPTLDIRAGVHQTLAESWGQAPG